MARILKGAPVAAGINERSIKMAQELKSRGISPTLAILRVGERPDDLSYERGATKRCAAVGVAVKSVALPESVSQPELMDALARLNADAGVHGILVFRPLPPHLDEEAVRALLAPAKDVDGITGASLAGVFANTPVGFCPCTAQAAMEILEHYDIPCEGKRAVVLGRSLVVGRPAAMLLQHKNATVTICHSKTVDVPEVTRAADIVVVCMGRMESVGADYFSAGQTVIDVGIGFNEQKNKLCGDVDFDAAEPVVDAITPVPGGVGAVTTAVLVNHVVEAAARQSGMEMNLTKQSCEEFISALASKAPTPGGGGASALMGAIGTALADMVGSLTLGKKKYADVQDDVARLKADAEKLERRFLDLMDADARAFAPLAKAYRLPHDTEEERLYKEEVMENALRDACAVPIGIMECCCDAICLIDEMEKIGSVIAISDAACAATCCQSALLAASVNVFINTKSMKDREYAQKLEEHADEMLDWFVYAGDEIFWRVMEKLREE